jgi:hypothetical protein
MVDFTYDTLYVVIWLEGMLAPDRGLIWVDVPFWVSFCYFVCVWTMIGVGVDMVVHDNY